MANQGYFEKVAKGSNTMLRRWRDTPVRVWEVTTSHRSLVLVLGQDPTSMHNLVVACIGPIRMEGPFEWSSSSLEVRIGSGSGGEPEFRVVDEAADFEIRCPAVEVKENVRL